MLYNTPSINEIIQQLDSIIESLENQPNSEDYYVAVELAYQLRDEILDVMPEEQDLDD